MAAISWLKEVRAATAGSNITLSGAQTIDGVAVVAGDEVLVKDQTTASQNGTYAVVNGNWTRRDAAGAGVIAADAAIRVSEGTVNAHTEWYVSNQGAINLGTTAVIFRLLKPSDSWKDAVRVGTTGNITLSGTQTIDGIAVAVGDRILVKDQTTASQNGIYLVASGSWPRAVDTMTPEMAVRISEGTLNAHTAWVLATQAPITLGTTALTFATLKTTAPTSVGSIAGSGTNLQNLSGPFSVNDLATAEGYWAAADGGGGDFAFDATTITSTQLLTATVSTTSGINVSPITITTSAAHSFVNGQSVVITGVLGNTAANGTWIIAGVTSTTFTLNNSKGNGNYTSGGSVNSVNITASAAHKLVSGQRVIITRNSISGINVTWYNIGVNSSTVFSIATSTSPGTGGTFGDGGRSIPSTAVNGRWLRVDTTLNVRYYGAKCDGSTDDSAAVQAVISANPGGRYLLPGSAASPVTIYMGSTSLKMVGWGYILEGGGASFAGGGAGGTTLRWAAGATGILAILGSNGTIRDLNLQGSEPFIGAGGGTWPDAILPNFTDQTGTNLFSWPLLSMSRSSNVVTVTVGAGFGGISTHTYSVGTQVTISGVSEHPEMNGLYYITAVGPQNGAGFNTFTYANSGADVSTFNPAAGLSSISNTGTSTADAIVAGTSYLRLENLNIQYWGRFGINSASDLLTYTSDDQNFRNITIVNCRGIGTYNHGPDSQASDFYQINSQSNLVGGICDGGFLGNTWVAPNVSDCGVDFGSIGGATTAVSSLSCTSNVVTVTTSAAHGLLQGQAAVLTGLADSSFQAPAGSAVFVASVLSGTQFTYNFTHANGSAGSGGTVRLATGTELYTVAGTGQAANGLTGTGFSYWISGAANNRVVLNPYVDGANGPMKLGYTTITLGGTLGAPIAGGYDFPSIRVLGGATTNITTFDSNLNRLLPDKGTTISLQGGQFQETANQLTFLGHAGFRSRWYIRDEPQNANPHLIFARRQYSGVPRLTLYQGQDVYNIQSAVRSGGLVTVTTTASHGIGFSSDVVIAGVTGGATSFNGFFQVLGVTTDNTFQYFQSGPDESANPGTGTATTALNNFVTGETRLSAENAGSIAFNYDGGTGGVRFCDGNRIDVAAVDGSGKVSLYKSIATVSNGVPSEYAQANVTGQSASIGSTTLYAVPSTGSGIYRISYYLKVTTAASTSGSVTLSLGWTDEDDSTVATITIPSPANATNSTGIVSGTVVVDAKLSTNVTYSTTYTSTGATSLVYKLRLRLEAL